MSGNAETVRGVIDAAAGDLLRYFRRRVDDREDAADLVGDTLAAAWRSAARAPRDPVEARMWLFGIAKNMLHRHGRTRRYRDTMVAALGAAMPAPRWADVDQGVEVRAAVDALPPELAELVRLLHWDGFSTEQAATLLGLSASTARSRHARAKHLLRGTLSEPAEPSNVARS